MKKIGICLAVLVHLFIGCKRNVQINESGKGSSMMDTKEFPIIMEVVKDTTKALELINHRFTFIGEESFINGNNYDYYLIYYIMDRTNIDRVYVIKSKNNLNTISYKEIVGLKFHKYNNFSPIRIVSKTKAADKNTILIFKEKIDSLIIKEQNERIGDYKGKFQQIYYYANGEYYYTSDEYYLPNTLDTLESMFNLNDEFKQVINLDSIPDLIWPFAK